MFQIHGVTRHLRIGRAAGMAVFILPASGAVLAKEWTHRVKFARGRSSAVMEGAVVRGDRDRYILGAKRGQTMNVRITSLEDNAVFTIYPPGDGPALRGIDEERGATRWTGRLPRSGNYAIVVGGTRGNATYTLRVGIR